MRRDAVRLPRDRVGVLDERHDFVRDAAVQGDVLLEQREHAPREDVQRLRILDLGLDVLGERRPQVAGARDIPGDART
jgi:hypothetical protein